MAETGLAAKPLAVDLDGTLIHSDLFAEAILRFLTAAPWKAPLLLAWLARGRAYAKARLAQIVACDPATLPYDQRVLAWLKEERAKGRILALATASDQRDAERVATHLGLFDRVFASDGSVNLKSRRKAAALVAAYPQGFVYAGNESADLRVWAAAAGAVVANSPSNVARKAAARFTVEKTFPRTPGTAGSFFSTLAAHAEVRQFLRFLIVGATATSVQYVVLILLVEIAKQPQFWSAVAAYLCGLVASYLFNRRFTFAGTQTHFGKAFAKFFVVAITGLGLNMAIFAALTSAGVYYLLAQVVATGLVLIWNYAGSKLFVFR